jgi:hypothetical protein
VEAFANMKRSKQCRDLEEMLDILDQELLKQGPENGLESSVEAPKALTWWSRHAKAEMTKQRQLKGQQSHKISKHTSKGPKYFNNRRQ